MRPVAPLIALSLPARRGPDRLEAPVGDLLVGRGLSGASSSGAEVDGRAEDDVDGVPVAGEPAAHLLGEVVRPGR